jgi:predicted Fe-Mo cluster-binding NifX family protein
MKVAVTSKGVLLDSEVDPRFGRAPYILIVDTATLAFEAIDNSDNVNAFKGAGIQAATMVSDKGAEVLMTGYCGPKAFATLEAAGIKVISDVSGKVRGAVAAFNAGTLTYASAPNKEAHW